MIEEKEELVSVVGPQVDMMVHNPMIADGSTNSNVTLPPHCPARNTNNGPMANHITASPSPFGEITKTNYQTHYQTQLHPCDSFMGSFHCIQLKNLESLLFDSV